MDSAPSVAPHKIAHDFRPFFFVHVDGHVQRLLGGSHVPATDDPLTAVRSRDVVISTEVSARLYLPGTITTGHKLPVLVYVHGGAFCIESAFSANYHQYLNSLVAAAEVVVVSVEYRLAPEHPIPECYEDAWTALQWVAQHGSGQGPDPWLNQFGDLSRLFFAGDSAGANIAHDLVIRSGLNGLGPGCTLAGIVLIHPFFGDGKSDKLWEFLSKETGPVDDPKLNPAAHPALLAGMVCRRMLICIAERDFLRERGWNYYNALGKSDWEGIMEIQEIEGEEHVFHLHKPNCDNSRVLMNRIVSFINQT